MKDCCKKWNAKEIEVTFQGWGCIYTFTGRDITTCPECGSSLTKKVYCESWHFGDGFKHVGSDGNCAVCHLPFKPIEPAEEMGKVGIPKYVTSRDREVREKINEIIDHLNKRGE